MTQTMISAEGIRTQWDYLNSGPQELGKVEMLVVRRASDARESRLEAYFSTQYGMEGDRWQQKAGQDPVADSQISLMGSRILKLLAGEDRQRMALAGDNIVLDLDLSDNNLQAGDKLQIGAVILEVTPKVHKGCKKFAARYGAEALKVINSVENRHLHLRGIFTRVIHDGLIRVGDNVQKL